MVTAMTNAAPIPLDPDELLAHAREFVFLLIPDETNPVERERHAVVVAWRGPGAWAITDRYGHQLLNRHGQWEHEPLPSERTQAFQRRTRFARDEAVHRARKLLEAERAEITEAGFALDARGVFAYTVARDCSERGDLQVTATWRAQLDERDRVAFDRLVAAQPISASTPGQPRVQ